ncbi:extracellular solute-binding protein, partial [Rhizobium johnstonii]
EAANPDVDIEMIYAPHDAYNEKFSAAVMAKQLPDIMELDAPFLANYVWSGYLQAVKPLIDKDLLDDMTDSNIAQGTYPIDKDLYAIGLTDSSVVLYGNKKYLEAIGARIPKSVDDAWTREEFEGYLEKLSKLEGVKWPIDTFRGYGIKTEWITYAYGPLLESAGCDLIDRKTWKASGTLDGEACVKALTMMQDWVKKGWVVPTSS